MRKFRPEVIAALGVAAIALIAAPLVLLPEDAPEVADVATGASLEESDQRVELKCPDVLHHLDPIDGQDADASLASLQDADAPSARRSAAGHPTRLGSLDGGDDFDSLVNDLDASRTGQPGLARGRGGKAPRPPKIRPQPRDGSVISTDGNNQEGAPMAPLAKPLVVSVLDGAGVAKPGLTVEFYVIFGGGSLSVAQAVTDANGNAETALTLGPLEGWNGVGFKVERSRGNFYAKAVANPAPTLSKISGDAQSAIAGMPIKDPVVVQVLDGQGQPMPNTQVTFAVAAGGGAVNPPTAATDAQGYAQAQWVLGPAAGDNALGVSAQGVPGSLTFTAKGLPANPVAAVLEKTSGDAQQAQVGTKLANPLVVTAKTAQGAPVANVPVTFAVASGGGQLSLTQVMTDAQGLASTELTLGAAVAANSVTASSPGLTPVTFTANALAVPATALALVAGDKQTAVAGSKLPLPLEVSVVDANNQPVQGFDVSFAVATGGGTLSASTLKTDANGYAKVEWTLGFAAGAQTVTVNAAGLTGSPLTLSATATAAPATQLALAAGDKQTAVVGTKLATPLQVQVLDTNTQPVQGFDVAFAVTAGGGTLSGATVKTDAQGLATVEWTLGATAGAQTVTANAAGLTGSPITFTATAQPMPAGTLVLVSGDAQTGVVGTKLANPLVVALTDANAQPAANVAVTFAVAAGGGTLSATTVNTDAQGRASVELTLGATPVANAVTASVGGAKGSPVTFNATATPAPGTLAIVSGDKQTAVAGNKLANPLVVSVVDASNQPVAGFDVTFAIAAGAGTLSASTVKTNAQGQASVEWTLGTAGANAVTVGAAGQNGSPLTFTATATAPAGMLSIASGNNQTGVVATKLANPLVVLAVDNSNQPVVGLDVTFAVAAGGGTLSATAVKTDAQGMASTELTLGATPVANTVTATVPGQAGATPLTFTATATPAPGTLAKVSGDQQTGLVGAKLANPLVVSVVDANNQPVAGFDVTFAVAAGGGTLSASAVKTNAQGLASVELTLGAAPGANTVTASAAGQNGSPVTFGAMAQAPTPAALVAVSGDAQTGRAAMPLADPLVVQVNDAQGAPLAGVNVTFAVATGAGTLNPTTATTDAQGRASTLWTLGMNVQAQSVTASVTGVTPVTFNAMAVPLTYVDDVKPILTAKCIVCHAPGGVFAAKPLTNYQQVTSQVSFGGVNFVVPGDPANSALVQKTSPGGTMNQYVTPAEIAVISDWVLSGAVQTTQVVVPTTLAIAAGNNQNGSTGQPLTNPLVVRVTDMNGDPLAGVVVNWQVTAGGGAVSEAMTMTDATGQSSTLLTLGAAAGTNTVRASVANLTPVDFSAMGAAGFNGAPLAGSANPLDVAALVALRANSIEPAALCSDEEFLSRVTADLLGRLPSEQEVVDFLASNAADKRAAKIDALLASDEFANHWVRDLIGPWLQTRASFNETINNVQTTFTFDTPMIANVRADMPISQILSRLIQEQGDEGRAFWREHNDSRGHPRTNVIMEAFTGMSSKCARCHDHPLTSPLDDPRWVQDDNFGLYAFMAGNNEDARKINRNGGRFGNPVEPRFVVDGYANAPANLPTLADPLNTRRQAFAQLLSQSDAFYRGFSHRIWSEIATQLLDPNEFLRANLDAVTAPVLLDALATEFANQNTSLKGFLRMAMTSKLYQLSSERADTQADPYQGRYRLRRSNSEVLEQGVHQIAGRSLNGNTLFRFTFGAPNRNAIDSRRNEVSLDQAFVLLNAPEAINGKIGGGSRVAQLASAVDGNAMTFDEAVGELVRNGLGREPTAAELTACQQARAASANTNEALQDVAAALGASAEFVFR